MIQGGVEDLLSQHVGLAAVELLLVERNVDTHGREQVHLQAFIVLGIAGIEQDLLAEIEHHIINVDRETFTEECMVTFAIDHGTL